MFPIAKRVQKLRNVFSLYSQYISIFLKYKHDVCENRVYYVIQHKAVAKLGKTSVNILHFVHLISRQN